MQVRGTRRVPASGESPLLRRRQPSGAANRTPAERGLEKIYPTFASRDAACGLMFRTALRPGTHFGIFARARFHRPSFCRSRTTTEPSDG